MTGHARIDKVTLTKQTFIIFEHHFNIKAVDVTCTVKKLSKHLFAHDILLQRSLCKEFYSEGTQSLKLFGRYDDLFHFLPPCAYSMSFYNQSVTFYLHTNKFSNMEYAVEISLLAGKYFWMVANKSE